VSGASVELKTFSSVQQSFDSVEIFIRKEYYKRVFNPRRKFP